VNLDKWAPKETFKRAEGQVLRCALRQKARPDPNGILEWHSGAKARAILIA